MQCNVLIQHTHTHTNYSFSLSFSIPLLSLSPSLSHQLLPQYHNLWDFSSTPNLQTWLARMAQVPYHDDVMLCNKILGDASSLLGKRETFSVESMVNANKAAIKRFAALSEEMRPE